MNDRTRDRDSGRDYGRDRGGRDEAPRRERSSRDEPPPSWRRAVAEAVAPERGRRSLSESYGRDDAPVRGARESRGGRDTAPARGRSGGYEYRERDRAAVDKRAKMGNSDFDKIVRDGTKSWSPGDGANTIRILPPTWNDAQHFGVDVQVHYGIGPDRQSYLCLNKMSEQVLEMADRLQQDNPELAEKLRASAGNCPICRERALALKDGDEDYAKELDARRRVLVYVVDRDAEKEGLQVWAMPQSIDQDLAKVSVHRRTGAVLPIDHPDRGYDVEFDKEGKGKNTKYKGLAIAREESPLGNDDWLVQAEDDPLPTLLEFHDAEYIERVFGAAGTPAPRRDEGRDDRGGRDSGRDRDDRGSRDRDDRGRDRAPARDAPAPDPTWDEVHAMESGDLDKLAERECPKLDPAMFATDEDLADAICDEMGIPEPRKRAEPEPAAGDRLANMRRGR